MKQVTVAWLNGSRTTFSRGVGLCCRCSMSKCLRRLCRMVCGPALLDNVSDTTRCDPWSGDFVCFFFPNVCSFKT